MATVDSGVVGGVRPGLRQRHHSSDSLRGSRRGPPGTPDLHSDIAWDLRRLCLDAASALADRDKPGRTGRGRHLGHADARLRLRPLGRRPVMDRAARGVQRGRRAGLGSRTHLDHDRAGDHAGTPAATEALMATSSVGVVPESRAQRGITMRYLPVGAAAAAAAGGYATLYRLGQTWGATDQERQQALAGDELLPNARAWTTHAITIEAPAPTVWPWLVQMGWGRAAGIPTAGWTGCCSRPTAPAPTGSSPSISAAGGRPGP